MIWTAWNRKANTPQKQKQCQEFSFSTFPFKNIVCYWFYSWIPGDEIVLSLTKKALKTILLFCQNFTKWAIPRTFQYPYAYCSFYSATFCQVSYSTWIYYGGSVRIILNLCAKIPTGWCCFKTIKVQNNKTLFFRDIFSCPANFISNKPHRLHTFSHNISL